MKNLPTKKHLDMWERLFITLEGSKNDGYNSTDGGDENPMFGKKHTPGAIEKISNRSKGINNPMYGKVSAMKNKSHSKETILKMSDASKNRKRNEKGYFI